MAAKVSPIASAPAAVAASASTGRVIPQIFTNTYETLPAPVVCHRGRGPVSATVKRFAVAEALVDPGHHLPIEMRHSAVTYGVNDRGKLVAQWTFGAPAVDLAHDSAMILRGVPLRTAK